MNRIDSNALFLGMLLSLVSCCAVDAQVVESGSGIVLRPGQQTADQDADRAFQYQLGHSFNMPNFVVVDDRPVSEMPTEQSKKAATSAAPRKLEPTPAKRPPHLVKALQSPQRAASADSAPSPQQLKFAGPPIRPAQPFVGWKFGRSARVSDATRVKTPAAEPARVALVPQYMAYMADNPRPVTSTNPAKAVGGRSTPTAIAKTPSPSNLGRSGGYFLLQNQPNSVAKADAKKCPNCGRTHNVQVADRQNGKVR
jgi:hypothetical protein